MHQFKANEKASKGKQDKQVIKTSDGSSPRGRARLRAFGMLASDEPLADLVPVFKATPPPKSVSDLPQNWKEIMMECALQGKGAVSFMVFLGICHTGLNNLLRDSDEFARHYESCLRVQRAWFDDKGLEMMVTGRGQPQIWSLMMANQFGWRSSKAEISGDVEKPLQVKVDYSKMSDAEIDAALGIPTEK